MSLTQQLHYVQITPLLSLVDPTRWLSLCLSPFLSPSLSLRLPPTDYPPNYVSKRNEKMYCVLLNASCVCLCSSSCHPLPLCRHCGLSMLQWSEEKGMCFKHHCIYRPFHHVISPVLLAAHTEAPFQQSHLYTSYFTHWIMWRVEVSPVKLQRTLWLLYRFCIRVQVGKLRPLKLPFRQQCRFFLLCSLEMEPSDYFTVMMKTHQSLIIKKGKNYLKKQEIWEG